MPDARWVGLVACFCCTGKQAFCAHVVPPLAVWCLQKAALVEVCLAVLRQDAARVVRGVAGAAPAGVRNPGAGAGLSWGIRLFLPGAASPAGGEAGMEHPAPLHNLI